MGSLDRFCEETFPARWQRRPLRFDVDAASSLSALARALVRLGKYSASPTGHTCGSRAPPGTAAAGATRRTIGANGPPSKPRRHASPTEPEPDPSCSNMGPAQQSLPSSSFFSFSLLLASSLGRARPNADEAEHFHLYNFQPFPDCLLSNWMMPMLPVLSALWGGEPHTCGAANLRGSCRGWRWLESRGDGRVLLALQRERIGRHEFLLTQVLVAHDAGEHGVSLAEENRS
jgi:hypothetical protein